MTIAVSGTGAVIVGRINADKRTDLATVNSGAGSVSVLLSKGNKRKFSPARTVPVGANPVALADEDLTGDGFRDLASTDGSGVSVLAGDGAGNFRAAGALAVGAQPDAIGRGDFNGDGGIDLVVANAGDDDVSVLLNHP